MTYLRKINAPQKSNAPAFVNWGGSLSLNSSRRVILLQSKRNKFMLKNVGGGGVAKERSYNLYHQPNWIKLLGKSQQAWHLSRWGEIAWLAGVRVLFLSKYLNGNNHKCDVDVCRLKVNLKEDSRYFLIFAAIIVTVCYTANQSEVPHCWENTMQCNCSFISNNF